MRSIKMIPVFAAAALLIGCGSQPEPAATTAPPATGATTEDVQETVEPGAPKGGMIGNYMVTPKGEAVDWDTTMYQIEDKGIMRVTLIDAQCGLDKLPSELFDEGMDSEGNLTGPQVVTPEAGNKFCLFTVHVENTGNTPVVFYGATGDVLAGEKQYAPAPQDDDINYRMELFANRGPLNPGASADVHNVIQVPADVDVTHVLFPKATLNYEPVYAFTVK